MRNMRIGSAKRTLLLYYDEYHTPVAEYLATSGLTPEQLRVLAVDLGDVAPQRRTEPPLGAITVDARARLCNQQLTPLVRANGCYQDGYHLSAAISRPLLARLCVEVATGVEAECIVHGFAGNDALRFVTGVKTLAPALRVESVAAVCGSRTRLNGEGYTISRNLAGLSIEAGPLERDSTESDLLALSRQLGLPAMADCDASARHVLGFVDGVPASLDGQEQSVLELVVALNAIGCRFGAGWVDMVEDGHVGYKTRALYFAPALSMLVCAHRDLERTIASPALNALKRPLDEQWARLIYRGHAFDPALRTLDAFMREANRGITGEVVLELAPGRWRVSARRALARSDDAPFAVYRAGQDFGFGLIEDLSSLQAWPGAHDPAQFERPADGSFT